MSIAKTKYGSIDSNFYINDDFMKEAYADVNSTLKLGEEGSLVKLAPTENAKIPVLSGTIPSISILLSSNDYQLAEDEIKQLKETYLSQVEEERK